LARKWEKNENQTEKNERKKMKKNEKIEINIKSKKK